MKVGVEMPANQSSIVEAASGEWKHWGEPVWNVVSGTKSKGHHTDDEDKFAEYILDKYVSLFFKRPIKWPTIANIGNDEYFWSAVTISFIMRKAGFSGPEFPISQAHATYITWAIKSRKLNDKKAAYWGFRVDEAEAQPDVGDLVGYVRGKGMTKAKALTYFDKTGSYPSHTDIVVAKRAGEIDVIGGNVRDSVTKKTLALDGKGLLADPVHNWFVVMKRV